MAFIQCDFFSTVLQLSVSMNVILPQPVRPSYPVLYLLHGLSDDHTIWMRRTSIERYADQYGLAVVMPAVGRSFYTNMAIGYRYEDCICQEIPEVAQGFFPLSTRREETFVAGLSMGGYGAFKLAFSQPERFAAAASLSGALDMAHDRIVDAPPEWIMEQRNIFGDLDSISGSRHDLRYLAEQLVASGAPQPRLYQCCGTEDFLYEQNQRFLKFARSLKLDLTYEEGPGEHEWGYWDMMIQRVLAWLPLAQTSRYPPGGSSNEVANLREDELGG
jgi:S-formylglutathione hydrolase FrmB